MGEREEFLNQGEFYALVRRCPCGSGLVSSWCRDERGGDIRACERCVPKLLCRIFEERRAELEESIELGEFVWVDFLKERGCERVANLEEAKRGLGDDILISCPSGGYVLVPRDRAVKFLAEGRVD